MDPYDEEVIEFLNNLNLENYRQNVRLEEIMEYINNDKRKYKVNNRIEPIQLYDDDEFERRYRLTKGLANRVYDLIDGQNTLEPLIVKGDFTISGMTKLLIALRFYAVGCFIEPLSDMFGVSKSTVCDIVAEVSYLIASKLRERYIVMPSNNVEIANAKAMFYRTAGFPLVIGAVDGTHIRIQSLGGLNAEYYRNRKTYFSINCQIVTSADVGLPRKMKIIDVCCRWPGSAHDATIFANSKLRDSLDRGELGNDSVILGDSAYGPQVYVCKPIHNPETYAERSYQRAQIKTRNVAERTFGVLKRTFPCLQLGMHCRLNKIQDIIVSCCILHNIRLLDRDGIDNRIEEYERNLQINIGRQLFEAQQILPNIDLHIRDFLINNYFAIP